MRIFLLKDIEKIGLEGEIVRVKDGFGSNYLVPRKLGIEVTPKNEHQFLNRVKNVEHRKEAIASKTSMLAEKIKSLRIKIKHKAHDEGKLFGAVSPNEVVESLAEKGISVSKSQIDFGKSIKTTGTYDVKVKLSSKLQPSFSLVVVAEKA
ncbi:MAG: 50S ribosomal protein L9 [Candidatus Dependentiae bacterium]